MTKLLFAADPPALQDRINRHQIYLISAVVPPGSSRSRKDPDDRLRSVPFFSHPPSQTDG